MASLTRKPTSQYWFACFRDRNGKQHRVSTHETRRSIAQKIADKYELAASRRSSRKQLWDTLNQLQELVGGASDSPSATILEFFELWLTNRKAEGIAKSTLDAYDQVIRRFSAFLTEGRCSRDNLITITKRDVERFRNELVGNGLAPATVNKGLKVLQRIFRMARVDGYIFDDPAETVRPVKGDPSRARRAFTLNEIRAVLAVADPEWQSLIKLGVFTGQRLGDLALLRWEHVDLMGGRLQVPTRKTGVLIQLPLTGPLKDHLLSLDSSDDPKTPLHPRAYALVNSQEGRVTGLSNQFAGLLAEAGLRATRTYEETGRGRSGPRQVSALSFHCLRHTTVSLLKNAGVAHAITQAFVGHESEAVSASYTHIGDQALGEALQKLPSL
jgi:integrase